MYSRISKFPEVQKALNLKRERIPALMSTEIEKILEKRGTRPSEGGTFSLTSILMALPSCSPTYEHNPLTVSNAVYTKAFVERRAALGNVSDGPVVGDEAAGPSTK